MSVRGLVVGMGGQGRDSSLLSAGAAVNILPGSDPSRDFLKYVENNNNETVTGSCREFHHQSASDSHKLVLVTNILRFSELMMFYLQQTICYLIENLDFIASLN